MDDRDGARRYAEPDEGLAREEPRRTYHEERQVIDYTGPLTRLVGVAGAVAAVVFTGYYLQLVGMGEQFATVAVIAVVFSLGYWADKRPDRARRRAGPFWRIADAIRASREDIRQYTYERPLRVAITLSVVYGVAIVLMKSALVAVLSGLYSWHLAAALGAAIGAAVVAPSFFRDVWSRVSRGPDDYNRYYDEADVDEEDNDAEMERARERRRTRDEDEE